MRLRANLEPRWFLFITFFIAGIFLGALSMYLYTAIAVTQLQKIHLRSSEYRYINPLLAVEIYRNENLLQDKSLELSIQGLIRLQQKNNAIKEMQVYFRDLESASWLSINGEGKFSPGKLLKLPIMIAYYKLAQANPDILNEQITFNGKNITSQEIFKQTHPLKRGESYTIEELIKQMIVQSDDDAANLLFDYIDKDTLNEVFSDLGIDFKEEKDTEDFISLKFYSLLFRILYNATYLTREYSQKAMDLLVEAPNNIGLFADIPQKIPTANRYGARIINNTKEKMFEIYDCGVVYYPLHPYIICAVVRGENLENIKSALSILGQNVYNEVKYQYQ